MGGWPGAGLMHVVVVVEQLEAVHGRVEVWLREGGRYSGGVVVVMMLGAVLLLAVLLETGRMDEGRYRAEVKVEAVVTEPLYRARLRRAGDASRAGARKDRAKGAQRSARLALSLMMGNAYVMVGRYVVGRYVCRRLL